MSEAIIVVGLLIAISERGRYDRAIALGFVIVGVLMLLRERGLL